MTAFRAGFTLIEILVTIAILAILAAVAVPRAATFLDAIAVHGASGDAESLLTRARHTAVARSGQVVVDIDTGAAMLMMRAGTDTLRRRDMRALYDVHVTASRSTIIYAPTGVGFGASNATLIFTKGASAETLFVSRLGRVR